MASPETDIQFFDRDVSWLEFNARVLHEAEDARTPLLERVRFLGIFSSNLDEFFMKRIARHRRTGGRANWGSPTETQRRLPRIRERVQELLLARAACYHQEVLPALAKEGIEVVEYSQLTPTERSQCDGYFRARVFPVLTPLAVDPGHPFPFISNLSSSLAVVLRHPGQDEKLFARVKVPESLPGLIRVIDPQAGTARRFVTAEAIIREHLGELFPAMEILSVTPFRVTRNADLPQDDEDVDDLMELVEKELQERRFSEAVRLEYQPSGDDWAVEFLKEELGLSEEDVFASHGLLDYQVLKAVWELPMGHLKHHPWSPVGVRGFSTDHGDVFATLRTRDVMVHHPYESFSASTERFITAAVDDPKVLAIKMTLYRTSEESPFLRTLIQAAEAGKSVVCMVELKARFDEERNLAIAQRLEKAGVHVVYGIVGLKTHAKLALVVREEDEGIRCYVHIGTGNYNPTTAKVYTDLGLLTSRKAVTDDVVEMFNYLTGRSLKKDYAKLLVAPVNMKRRFIEMIGREAQAAREGRPCGIVAKMNALEDPDVCRSLVAAAEAGVRCDLIVRGFCTLMPQHPNLRIVSVIGRFLEHSRVYAFRNGCENFADGEMWIASADWMSRNLESRVEAAVPIEDPTLKNELWAFLGAMLADTRQAWDLGIDGKYTQRQPAGDADTGTHQVMMRKAMERAGNAETVNWLFQ